MPCLRDIRGKGFHGHHNRLALRWAYDVMAPLGTYGIQYGNLTHCEMNVTV